MIQLFQKMFCKHKWKYKFSEKHYSFISGFYYNLVYQCEKCGKWHEITTIDIKSRRREYRRMENSRFEERELVLPDSPLDIMLFGKDVAHMIDDYQKDGFDITAYDKSRFQTPKVQKG